jgi:hypothetical protein
MTFQIRPGAKFKRRWTPASVETVIRTRRRWRGEICQVLGFRRRRNAFVKARAQLKEIAS